MEWTSIVSEIVLPVIGLLVTVLIVPLLRTWLTGKAKSEEESVKQALARSAVEAAQQVFGIDAGNGAANDAKYRFAAEVLKASGVSEEDSRRLIESAVYQIKQVVLSVGDVSPEVAATPEMNVMPEVTADV